MKGQKPGGTSRRGGARENAGRKSIWRNKETCTMRIPRIFAQRLHEIAQEWDKKENYEFETQSKPGVNDFVSESMSRNFEKETKSMWDGVDNVTNSKNPDILQLSAAIELARQILRHKKSARISLAKFLAKFYKVKIKFEDLK